jgi:hypothetical protein
MPPRHTYWTILFGDKPTAFRSATQEELLPTFKQIQSKHPDAVMMWFARGKLWRSEEEARAAFQRPRFDRPRGPLPESFGRRAKPAPEWKEKPRFDRPQGDRPRGPKPEWKDKPRFDRPPGPKPAWQNRDRPRDDRPRGPRPEWKEKPRVDRPPGPPPAKPKPHSGEGWKPRSGEGGQNRGPKPEWRDKPQGDRPRGPRPEWQNRGPRPEWKDKPQGDRPRGPKPAWKDKPRFDRPPDSTKPGSGEGGRGRDWRPGGEHKDPRDRFKVPRDVKRARFKQKLRRDRTRPKPASPPGPRKKKDEE